MSLSGDSRLWGWVKSITASLRSDAMAARMGEKVPGWVERLLIPTLESKIRTIVKEEVGHLEKVMEAEFQGVDARFQGADGRFQAMEERFDALEEKFETRFNALEEKLEARFETLDTKIDSLDKRFPFAGCGRHQVTCGAAREEPTLSG